MSINNRTSNPPPTVNSKVTATDTMISTKARSFSQNEHGSLFIWVCSSCFHHGIVSPLKLMNLPALLSSKVSITFNNPSTLVVGVIRAPEPPIDVLAQPGWRTSARMPLGFRSTDSDLVIMFSAVYKQHINVLYSLSPFGSQQCFQQLLLFASFKSWFLLFYWRRSTILAKLIQMREESVFLAFISVNIKTFLEWKRFILV